MRIAVMGSLAIAIYLGLMLLAPQAHAALEIAPLWSADIDMVMEGAPIVVDLDGDGNDEIITAAYEAIIALDGSGEERWRCDTDGRYSTCPAVLEREGASPLVFAGDNTGLFTCVDGLGSVVWQANIGAVFGPSSSVSDLDGDGNFEVLQGNQAGILTALDALTGDLRWTCQLEGECSSPAIADIDDDGKQEIVIGTGAGRVYAVNASGEVQWNAVVGETAPPWSNPSPVVFKDSTGAVRIAAASFQGRVACLDRLGNPVWSRQLRGPVASTLSVGDIDRDGIADIFVVTGTGMLYRFDERGLGLWEIDTQGRSLAPGALFDLDGDGSLEYLLCTQQGNLLAFSETGDMLYNHQFDNRTINMTVAFGDLVPDRPGLEFAVTGGESGNLFCFGLPATDDAQTPWRTYRSDNRLTGAWFGLGSTGAASMQPENLDWDRILTGDPIQFRIECPDARDAVLHAEATCLRPDGSRQAAVGKVAGRSGVLQLPLAVTGPGVYEFSWRVDDGAGKAVASGVRSLTLQPYGNDHALAARAVRALREASGETKGRIPAKGLKGALAKAAQELEAESRKLAELQAETAGAEAEFIADVNRRTAALNERAARAIALSDLASATLTQNVDGALIPFEGTVWENRAVDRQLPGAIEPLSIARRCVPGEHEPVCIKLLNLSAETVVVRAVLEGLNEGVGVTPFEVQAVPTNQGDVAWDPLVPIGDNGLSIPPLETREVWLDIDLAKARPGAFEMPVRFEGGNRSAAVAVTLDVLPFTMADPAAMRLCAWARYNEDAVRDLLAHGNTVFTPGLPPATVEEGDTPRVSIDFASLDEFLAPLAGHDVYLLMSGVPSLGVPMESEAYVPRLAEYLDALMSHLAGKGIPEDRVALYPHDEPGVHGWDVVNHYIDFARQGLEARPGLKFYVNGPGDLAMYEALNEVASIWCPSFYVLNDGSPESNFLKESGKTLWSYDCFYLYSRPIGPNTKSTNVVAQYRMAAVNALHAGATGIGYWCYNVGDSIWEPVEFEYPLVYVNDDGTHTTSRRWEAVREGMEDARILIALRDKLEDDEVDAGTKDAIRGLLDVTVAEFAQQSFQEARLGVARYVLDASHDDAAVTRFRDELMDCVERVGR